jgi:hypothetical protein
MHRRKASKLQQRKIRGIIFRGSFYDKNLGETVSKITRSEVIARMAEPVEVHVVPDIEKGEVLLDPRGTGSLQGTV